MASSISTHASASAPGSAPAPFSVSERLKHLKASPYAMIRAEDIENIGVFSATTESLYKELLTTLHALHRIAPRSSRTALDAKARIKQLTKELPRLILKREQQQKKAQASHTAKASSSVSASSPMVDAAGLDGSITLPRSKLAEDDTQTDSDTPVHIQPTGQIASENLLITAMREHTAALNNHASALDRHTAAMEKQITTTECQYCYTRLR